MFAGGAENVKELSNCPSSLPVFSYRRLESFFGGFTRFKRELFWFTLRETDDSIVCGPPFRQETFYASCFTREKASD